MSLAAAPTLPDPVVPSAPPPPAAAACRGCLERVLPLRHAGPRRVTLRWECVGAAGAPLLLVQGGISATRHLAADRRHPEPGWWDAQVGPGRALDPARLRLLSIDWLGADGALDLPLDPADQAEAIASVLDHLGVAQAHAFVGASYGAMVALQFAARHPARVRQVVAISGAHRSHPQATAWRVVQRRIVALGRREGARSEALALARALAVIGYRSAEEFAQRFDAAPSVAAQARFAVEDYFDAVGPRFAARFDGTAYLRLSESIDLQRLAPEALRVPLDLVAVRQDQIVPLADLQTLASRCGAPCRLHVIDSRYGHDAFLKETAAIDALLRAALATGVAQ